MDTTLQLLCIASEAYARKEINAETLAKAARTYAASLARAGQATRIRAQTEPNTEVRSALETLTTELGRSPTVDEVARRVGLSSPAAWRHMKRLGWESSGSRAKVTVERSSYEEAFVALVGRRGTMPRVSEVIEICGGGIRAASNALSLIRAENIRELWWRAIRAQIEAAPLPCAVEDLPAWPRGDGGYARAARQFAVALTVDRLQGATYSTTVVEDRLLVVARDSDAPSAPVRPIARVVVDPSVDDFG